MNVSFVSVYAFHFYIKCHFAFSEVLIQYLSFKLYNENTHYRTKSWKVNVRPVILVQLWFDRNGYKFNIVKHTCSEFSDLYLGKTKHHVYK